MSVLQTPADYSQPNMIPCKRCGTLLPVHATFCGACGERITQKTKNQLDTTNIGERYRIVSLIRRHACVELFFAIDNQHQRPVVICDIDISRLNDDARADAIKAAQREYDLLRSNRMPNITPVIDLRYFEGHLFMIAGWPFAKEPNTQTQIHTLQDLLQSGIGLPDEQIAITWIYQLCQAVSSLHANLIVIGDLDPSTILVSDEHYEGTPALIVGWLPLPIRSLLSHVSTHGPQHFTAPEVLSGAAETGSDIYSLGAILYLLLTGVAPEEPERRQQQPLRSPRELNSHVSVRLAEVAMRALAIEVEERFEDVEEMAMALQESSSATKPAGTRTVAHKAKPQKPAQPQEPSASPSADEPYDDSDDVTISVAPIQAQLARWYMSRISTGKLQRIIESDYKIPEEPALHESAEEDADNKDDIAQQATRAIPYTHKQKAAVAEVNGVAATTEDAQREQTQAEPLPTPLSHPLQIVENETSDPKHDQESAKALRFKERISGLLPAIPRLPGGKSSTATPDANEKSLLKRLQRFLLGEQQRSTTAAALIETPLRIQPNQGYALRIHIIGRDTPTPPPHAKKDTPTGLSALIQGEKVHIEVRSSLFQNYAYIVQRADVEIPARGYAAEVTIPMQALTTGPSGRRERLHVFFMNDARQPLYEKPFVIELFISHLVQSGREGHNVLSIPL